MYKYYNAHPKGHWVDDSLNRAVAVTTRMGYVEAQNAITQFKKSLSVKSSCDENDAPCFLRDVIGGKMQRFSRLSPVKMTAARFCKTHRNGRYILEMEGHFSACVNGVILDTWDPSDETVLAAYKVIPVRDEQDINLRFCYTVHTAFDDEMCVVYYDGNGKSKSKTLSEDDARIYIDNLSKHGYPDMTEAVKWL